MKKLLYIFLSVLVVTSCRPDDFPPIGERNTIVPQLAGTWKLTQVIQIDNDAARKGFPAFAQTQDVTSDFPFSEFSITLNTDAEGNPTTYTITTGNSPNIIGDVTSGAWTTDDVAFPSKIQFGLVSIELGSFAELANGAMQFKLVRLQDNNVVVTYQYVFTKQ
jgi:hypothetical protein